MMFAHPGYFFFLLVLPIFSAFYFLNERVSRRNADRFVHHDLLAGLTPTISTRRRRAKRILALGALAFITIAAARPLFGNRTQLVQKRGVDIVMVLDTSESMRASDMKPSRFQTAARSISRIVRKLTGDRVGLVGFAGDGFIQSPLTTDYDGYLVLLDALQLGSIPVAGTNLEIALDKSLLAMERGGHEKNGVIVIFTDGENHVGDLDAAIARVKEKGAIVYTVGVGTEAGSPLPVEAGRSGPLGSYKRDRDGNVIISRLDSVALEKIANETGGKYFAATPNGTEVDEFFSELERFAKTPVLSETSEAHAERFQIFLACAFLLLIIEFVLGIARARCHTGVGRMR